MKTVNKLYVVAGRRNMGAHAALNGGLFANVGMTTRTVDERLSDPDYRNKAAGGAWKVIVRDHEIGTHDDTEIHDELKKRDDVVWSLDGLNTEEFLFVNDPGDGSVARDIVLQIAKNLSPRDKCIEPNASIEQDLLDRGIPHAGEIRNSNGSVCWLRVKSVIERNGPYGKYVIVYFDSRSRDKAIFVWKCAAKEFPVGNYVMLSGVRVSNRGNLECKGSRIILRETAKVHSHRPKKSDSLSSVSVHPQEASDIDSVSPACEEVSSTNLAASQSHCASDSEAIQQVQRRRMWEDRIVGGLMCVVPLGIFWLGYHLSS
jgi:hypothetical protein